MLILLNFIFLGISCVQIHANTYPECMGDDKLQTFVASRESCSKYIFCDGENSFEGECLGDNHFNEKAGECDDPENAQCGVATNEISGNNPGSNSQQQQQGTTSNNEFNPPNTIGSTRPPLRPALPSVIIQLANHESQQIPSFSGSWQLSYQQQQQQQQQPSMYLEQYNYLHSQNTQQQSSSRDPQCPLSPYDSSSQDHITYLANMNSCSAYYACYNGIAIPMNCARNMNFNAAQGRCVSQDNTECMQMERRPLRLHCLKGIYDFIPHPRNCEYYYFCSNGFLMIFQCPLNYKWHYERRTCVHRSQAKCFSQSLLEEMYL